MFKFCLIMDYSNSVLAVQFFQIRQISTTPKLSWHNLHMSGYWSNTALARILYLKMVFPTLSDSLFAKNHSLSLIDSSLTILKIVFKLLLSKKKKIASPANIIGTSTFEELRRSFTYSKNNNDPSIESCDTPDLISFFTV